jgi:integrase/recombinase XerD
MGDDATRLPARTEIYAAPRATRAETDEQLLMSWLDSLNSPHTRRNFEQTGRRFLAGLPMGLRAATVEDVREALISLTGGLASSSARQYVLRVKSLLGYSHELGFTVFNAGATIKVRSDAGNRGATLAKRIISEVEVGLLIRAARRRRDRVLLEVTYAGGLRVSEVVSLRWEDVLSREEDRVQLSITGKGGKVRQVLLPETVSRSLLSLRGETGAHDPVFVSRKGGRLTERAVNGMVKRAAKAAGITGAVSPHWLRHAHGSHAIDRGASLPEVQTTLGHDNIATTSGYLHARPDSSSGLKLDPGVFLRRRSRRQRQGVGHFLSRRTPPTDHGVQEVDKHAGGPSSSRIHLRM